MILLQFKYKRIIHIDARDLNYNFIIVYVTCDCKNWTAVKCLRVTNDND